MRYFFLLASAFSAGLAVPVAQDPSYNEPMPVASHADAPTYYETQPAAGGPTHLDAPAHSEPAPMATHLDSPGHTADPAVDTPYSAVSSPDASPTPTHLDAPSHAEPSGAGPTHADAPYHSEPAAGPSHLDAPGHAEPTSVVVSAAANSLPLRASAFVVVSSMLAFIFA